MNASFEKEVVFIKCSGPTKEDVFALIRRGQPTAAVPPPTPHVTGSPRNGCDQSVHVRNCSVFPTALVCFVDP